MTFPNYSSREAFVDAAKKQALLQFNDPFPAVYSLGITAVDDFLSDIRSPGNYILIGAPTGGGKTILAGQIASLSAWTGKKVLILSTETPPYEYVWRIASLICEMPYERIKDGFVVVDDYFETQLGFLKWRLEQRLQIVEIAIDYHPGELIYSTLDYIGAAFTPDVLVFDYIRAPIDPIGTNPDIFRRRNAMLEVSRALKQIAAERTLLAYAFSQVEVDNYQYKKIGPDAVAESKDLAEPADAFIGISHLHAPETSMLPYSEKQFFTITKKGKPAQLFPVWANFSFQRFQDPPAPRGPSVIRPTGGFGNAAAHHGFVLMRRDRFRQVCDLNLPNCVNLYFFLLLVVSWNGPSEKLGTTFRSRRTIAKELGLTEKMVRTAVDRLVKAGLIAKKPFRRGWVLRIINWKSEQDPGHSGYIKLFRNLRDESRDSLRAKPALFRVWLYCLSEARALEDGAAEIDPGRFLIDHRLMAERIGEREENVASLLENLEDSGRIKIRTRFGGRREVEVVHWELYQHQL